MNRTTVLVAAVLLPALTGCAVRRPGSATYRLVDSGTGAVLVPPGVEGADVTRRTVEAGVRADRGACPPEIRPDGKRLQVAVTRELLSNKPPGWLAGWTAGLEERGCIAPGAAPELARRVAEALPLPLNLPFRLLHSDQLDIAPGMRLQVVSPILGEGGGAAEELDVAETATGLTITMKAPANLVGFEEAWYAVRPGTGGAGVQIVPLYAERRIDGEVERRPRPESNLFQLAEEAAFYRVFYKATMTEYTALVVAAPSPSELARRTRILETGKASCEALEGRLCAAVPKGVAVNGFIPVRVNGAEIMVPWRATLREAIRIGGGRQAGEVLPTLAVSRVHDGRPAPVEFDRSSAAILGLILTGGETVTW
jgi:hypothetical protein